MVNQQQNQTTFAKWLAELNIGNHEAASLLGKTVRAIEYYKAGKVKPPVDTRKLMTIIREGQRPSPWPE